MDGRRHGLGDDDETIIVGKMTLSEIIARRAKDYGLNSQGELAAAMEITQETMSRILRGKNKIGIKTARALVRALDLDPGVIERSVSEK